MPPLPAVALVRDALKLGGQRLPADGVAAAAGDNRESPALDRKFGSAHCNIL